MIKTLLLPRTLLNLLNQWLHEVQLIRSEARSRIRFINLLKDKISEIEPARIEILERYVEKDEIENKSKKNDKGEFVWKTPTGEEEATKEFRAYMDEKVLVDFSPENHADLDTMKTVLTDRFDKKLNAVESVAYDEILTEFERVCGT